MDFTIVGAGISGCTIARVLVDKGYTVQVIEKNSKPGGNCSDYFSGNKYFQEFGPHIFHTDSDRVWTFLSRFSNFNSYIHEVKAFDGIKLYTFPINLTTLEELYLSTLDLTFNENPKSIKEDIESRMGKTIYEKFFKEYTTKQWGVSPEILSSEISNRIPIRQNRDNRYFTDKYQGIPELGYTYMCYRMLEGIPVQYNTKFVNSKGTGKLIITSPIDEFFNYSKGKLPYRSVEFKPCDINFKYTTINLIGKVTATRITNYNALMGIKHSQNSWVEIPIENNNPMYPIPGIDNPYSNVDDTIFLGRLGRYKYLNMDKAILEALELGDSL